jgi:hypothetical protein
MRAIAAPTLQESYIAALDGFVVGAHGGTFGAAVNRREPVFVSDVLTDPIVERRTGRNRSSRHSRLLVRTDQSYPTRVKSLGHLPFTSDSCEFRIDMQLIDGASRIAAIAAVSS